MPAWAPWVTRYDASRAKHSSTIITDAKSSSMPPNRSGIEMPVKATRGHEIQIRRFEGGGVELISLRRNPGTEQPGSAEGAVRIHVTLPRQARVTAGARDLGVTQELDVDLDPWTPTLLELRAPR